jgi:hypothetical protein
MYLKLPKQLVWWSNIDIHNSKEVPENFFRIPGLDRFLSKGYQIENT